MLEFEPIDAKDALIIAGTALGMLGVGHYYNQYIDSLVDLDPLGNHGAMLTSLWLCYTLQGLFLVVGVLFGWDHAFDFVVVALITLIVSGVPLVLGDIRRGWRRRRDETRKAQGADEYSFMENIEE